MVSWNGGGGVNVASQVGCGARCRFVGVVWKDSSFESPKSPEVFGLPMTGVSRWL